MKSLLPTLAPLPTLLVTLWLGTAATLASADVSQIDIAQARALHSAGAQFVDTRSWLETRTGMVAGAIHLPHDRAANDAVEALPDKKETVVLYCRSGGRASQAAAALHKLGYSNVHVIANGRGFADWEAAGHPQK